jgi:hypothetical protein
VLPLVGRLRLDPTCLVVGSMSPTEYFLRGRLVRTFSHNLLGSRCSAPVTVAAAAFTTPS